MQMNLRRETKNCVIQVAQCPQEKSIFLLPQRLSTFGQEKLPPAIHQDLNQAKRGRKSALRNDTRIIADDDYYICGW